MVVWVVVQLCCGHMDLHSVWSTETKADNEVTRLDSLYLQNEYVVVPIEIDGREI